MTSIKPVVITLQARTEQAALEVSQASLAALQAPQRVDVNNTFTGELRIGADKRTIVEVVKANLPIIVEPHARYLRGRLER